MTSTTPPSVAPALSTFQDEEAFAIHAIPLDSDPSARKRLVPTDEFEKIYEISRTVEWVRQGGYCRVALQFPDTMLADAVRVVESLQSRFTPGPQDDSANNSSDGHATGSTSIPVPPQIPRFFILGDTSYGSCCVDEVAAEHGSADAIVHYGRACLSPTARLPVLWVYTTRPLEADAVVKAIEEVARQSEAENILLIADLPYTSHLESISDQLLRRDGGVARNGDRVQLWSTTVVHNPSASVPNRKIVRVCSNEDPNPHPKPENDEAELDLRTCAIFHVGTPPTALLLTLSSRVRDFFIHDPEAAASGGPSASSLDRITNHTAAMLARRYGTITSLSTAGVWGILVNTLSVREYSSMLDHVRAQLAAAGKKSYTVVVGKVNPAKVANFAEIDGWVVVGCWENSLVDVTIGSYGGVFTAGGSEFWKPMITPFELALALQPDHKRVWTGEWTTDLATVLSKPIEVSHSDDEDGDGNESDAPPEFDLRTGKYVSSSYSRPMAAHPSEPAKLDDPRARMEEEETALDGPSDSLVPKPSPESAQMAKTGSGTTALSTFGVAGVFSPGARFLHTNREWRGLGTDHHDDGGLGRGGPVEGAEMEEGIGGIARGYSYLETDMSDRLCRVATITAPAERDRDGDGSRCGGNPQCGRGPEGDGPAGTRRV